MGHEVGRNTVKRILAEHGIEPAPARDKRTPWSTFLKAHWGAIAATDFLTVEVLTTRGLIRYFVLFVIDLKTRRVEIAGIGHQPYDDWMKQMARNLTDAIDGFLRDARFLIHDRDLLFSASFCATLSATGVETVKLPSIGTLRALSSPAASLINSCKGLEGIFNTVVDGVELLVGDTVRRQHVDHVAERAE